MERKTTLAVAFILIIVVAIVLFLSSYLFTPKTVTMGGKNVSSYDDIRVPQQLLNSLNVPDSVSSVIGIGTASNRSILVVKNATPLTANGKPEVLYIGAEYCPYCAAQRWPLIIALSRFGTFSGLEFMTSSASDSFSNTPTFTFINSTYTSNYLTFVSVETLTNKPQGSGYGTLQTLTPAEQSIYSHFLPGGGIPFIDFGNLSIEGGSTYGPQTLSGDNWTIIATRIDNASTPEAQAIDGSANLLTAAICKMTNNTPSTVCSQSYISRLEPRV